MKFIGPSTSEQKLAQQESYGFKRKFALWPTHGATTEDGREIKVLFEFYERRIHPEDHCKYFTKYKDFEEIGHITFSMYDY